MKTLQIITVALVLCMASIRLQAQQYTSYAIAMKVANTYHYIVKHDAEKADADISLYSACGGGRVLFSSSIGQLHKGEITTDSEVPAKMALYPLYRNELGVAGRGSCLQISHLLECSAVSLVADKALLQGKFTMATASADLQALVCIYKYNSLGVRENIATIPIVNHVNEYQFALPKQVYYAELQLPQYKLSQSIPVSQKSNSVLSYVHTSSGGFVVNESLETIEFSVLGI
jgi:hypothetical protein